METISIRVDAKVAQTFHAMPLDQQRKIEAMLSIRLIEALQTNNVLEQVMRQISKNAQQRGLTPEILADILRDDE